ncbi:hypothetical protein [Okeania sp. SIO1I7]|uniref:hypothetical protein n=1 Tax=Okeania sp. SIO1I7 TaxID=2607772 RepID=UPI0013FBABCF|nr:hypothetical protein [Okeania sp. SIO1I7]NET29965.1 hypothetical protein [Okeania sp. SIO1I7]
MPIPSPDSLISFDLDNSDVDNINIGSVLIQNNINQSHVNIKIDEENDIEEEDELDLAYSDIEIASTIDKENNSLVHVYPESSHYSSGVVSVRNSY